LLSFASALKFKFKLFSSLSSTINSILICVYVPTSSLADDDNNNSEESRKKKKKRIKIISFDVTMIAEKSDYYERRRRKMVIIKYRLASHDMRRERERDEISERRREVYARGHKISCHSCLFMFMKKEFPSHECVGVDLFANTESER
jgi:hypothetical protein